MEWKQIIAVLDRYFNEDRCLERVTAIWSTDRWNDYERYGETADYCVRSMKDANLTEIEKLPLKADGTTLYGDWKVPKAWKVEWGRLNYEDGESIADYHREPCSLSMYCPSTQGIVRGEVMDVSGWAELPTDGSLQGKVLLTDKAPGSIAAIAHQAGAVGILSDGIPLFKGIRNSREEVYDTCIWQGTKWNVPVFSFKLTPRQGDGLRTRLKQGPVTVVADVRTESYDGELYTVSGALQGQDPALPEVFAFGHLYEPGANDNASGAGALLEMAACIEEAIAAGDLPRPKRTIRFAMGGECTGSMGYMAIHRDRPMLCGGIFDMVGTEEIDRAQLSLRYDPISHWSFADAALNRAVKVYEDYKGWHNNFYKMPFAEEFGTDNIIADPMLKVPSIALVASPALSYHSSMDTPDRIQKDILKRNALIMALYLYGLADADTATCQMLAEELVWMAGTEATQTPKQQFAEEALARACHSLCKIDPALPYEKPTEQVPPMPIEALGRGDRVPVRIVEGCICLSRYQKKEKAPYRMAWNAKAQLPLFWADGTRTLWEIAVQTAHELDRWSDEDLMAQFNEISGCFDFLADLGYLEWK